MNIVYHESTGTFHLYNDRISYIMTILRSGHPGQLYFGKQIRDKEDFSYFLEVCERPMSSCIYENDRSFSLEHIRQEYPVFGTTDYRQLKGIFVVFSAVRAGTGHVSHYRGRVW